MRHFDIIIIGGGAAGMMAAISAKRTYPNYTIAILDRTFALGRKILVCGAGRCNITNINLNEDFSKHYYGASSEFIESIFKQFSYQNILEFFNELGIELYVERKTDIGKLFPVTDQAKTVTALLEDELNRLQIEIFLNTDVESIQKDQNFKLGASVIDQEGKKQESIGFTSNYLILSAGGKTYPALGSNGSGYRLAESLKHTLIEPIPSALPLISKNPLSHELQGQKFEMEVTSVIEGNEIKTRTDDVMFTQYGLSGPAILNISREVSIHVNRKHKSNVQIKLNFFAGKTTGEVYDLLIQRWAKRPDQSIEKSLFGIFPNKFPSSLLKLINIDKDIRVGSLNESQKSQIALSLTSYSVDVQGTRGWNEAEFTAGGIDTNEIRNGTLESNKVNNLYFCGEIIDVDGDVGGFNLSWAWCSGFIAGQLQ